MLIFRLAAHLGKTASDILKMPSWEFTYWEAYDLIHPLPDHTRNAGMICAELWKSQVPKARPEPTDFYPLSRAYREKLERERKVDAERLAKSQAKVSEMNLQIMAVKRGVPVDQVLGNGKNNGGQTREHRLDL